MPVGRLVKSSKHSWLSTYWMEFQVISSRLYSACITHHKDTIRTRTIMIKMRGGGGILRKLQHYKSSLDLTGQSLLNVPARDGRCGEWSTVVAARWQSWCKIARNYCEESSQSRKYQGFQLKASMGRVKRNQMQDNCNISFILLWCVCLQTLDSSRAAVTCHYGAACALGLIMASV